MAAADSASSAPEVPRGAKLAVCVLCPVIVPAICLGLAMGLMGAEPDGKLSTMWTIEAGQYFEDNDYLDKVEKEYADAGKPLSPDEAVANDTMTRGLMVSKPRGGGNHITRDSIMELIKRQSDTEAVTVEHNGETYGYKDVCSGRYPLPGPLGEDQWLGYTLPCGKMTAVHAFKEGGYDMDATMNKKWFDELVYPFSLKPMMTMFVLSTDFPPYFALATPSMATQIADIKALLDLASTDVCIPQAICNALPATHPQKMTCMGYMCASQCAASCALPPVPGIATSVTMQLGFLSADPTCMACMMQAEKDIFAALDDKVLFPALAPTVGYDQNTQTKAQWLVATAETAIRRNPAIPDIPLDLFVKAALQITDDVNPFTNMNAVLAAGGLGMKGSQSIEGLDDNQTTTDKMLQWLSGPVIGWTPTVIYPPSLMFGAKGTTRAADGTLTGVEVLQTLYALLTPPSLVEKLSQRPAENGGPVVLSEDDAMEVLEKMKEAMEKKWSENWDNSGSSDVNKYYAFFDDAGSKGTFARKLIEFIEQTVFPSIVSYSAIIFVTMLLLAKMPLTESKMLVGTVGVLFSVVAFMAACGILVIAGAKLTFHSVWILPFLMVGLGVDDMYVILVSLSQDGGNTVDGHIKTMKEIIVPITMTSLTNMAMFGMLMMIPIPSARECGKNAVIGIALQWLIMVTAFPCCCYWDMLRQESGRLDCLCCVKGTRSTAFDNVGYNKVFKPVIQSKIGHIVVLAVTLTLLVVASYGATLAESGVGLGEFFQDNSIEMAYFDVRAEYFPTWPAQINFGDLKYTDPEVQLEMMKIIEDISADSYMTPVATKYLWTASLAKWGTSFCYNALGKAERCGDHFGCAATWVPDTKGLKLEDGSGSSGVCRMGAALPADGGYQATTRYCPVFKGWDDNKLVQCIRDWQTYGSTSDKVATGFAVDYVDKRVPRLPIKVSSTSAGLTMSNIGLKTNEDYQECIKQTRAKCDDVGRDGIDRDGTMPKVTSNKMKCWMSGLTYSLWEQYLTMWDTAGRIVGISMAGGFVVAFFFLFTNAQLDSRIQASLPGKLAASLCGALVIVLCAGLSLFTVFGLAGLAGFNLSMMSTLVYLMAIGFNVEYAVHIVHRFLTAPTAECTTAVDRVQYAMKMLTLPMGYGFVGSVTGLMLMLTTDIKLIRRFVFFPLVFVQLVSFFYGCWLVPVTLCYMPCLSLHVGPETKVVEDAPRIVSI